MDLDLTQQPRHPASPHAPPGVDEAQDWDIGPLDIALGLLTFPLLIWVMQYAVSGSEQLIATRASRLRIYLVLLAVEVIVVLAALAWWFGIR